MNKKNPLVSVIVPCYNHEKYVKKTIKSIVNQTYKNIELIVIDDGSKDDSPSILKMMSKKYGFYFESQKNIGLSATLNKAINFSKGKYISLTASDDFFELNKIELLVNRFESLGENYAVVSGDAQFIDENDNKVFLKRNNKIFYSFVNYYIAGVNDFDLSQDFGSYSSFFIRNYIPAMSTLLRKDALLSVGLYKEELCLEDWDMWFKLSKKYSFYYEDIVVANYRLHKTNSINTMTDRLNEDLIEILKSEHCFCYSNGCADKWNFLYYKTLLIILINGQIKLFFDNFKLIDIGKIIKFSWLILCGKYINKKTVI